MSKRNPNFEQKATNTLSNNSFYSQEELYTEGGRVSNEVANSVQSSTIYTEGGTVSEPKTEKPTTSVPKRQKKNK
ncbi:MAG TPA: hypothetical protein GXX38_07845 [Clostridia bacterium]|nr:hypothetical protein [Clostridia bacterium]